MKEAGLPEPVFQKEGIFTVVLSRPVLPFERPGEKTGEKTREKTREKILNAIRVNREITTVALAGIVGITEKGIEYQLQKLKAKNIIMIGLGTFSAKYCRYCQFMDCR